jgi:uroporphyrinogen-III synthase
VEALHRAGAETVEVPLTEQVGPSDEGAALRGAAKELGHFRWVVFTSVNAVERLMGEVRDARSLGSLLVAAVGPATAAALRTAGIEPDLVPAEHRAAGLVAEFPDHEPGSPDHEPGSPGNLILFPCAEEVPSTISEGLRAKGWEVRRIPAYRTVALPLPEDWLLERMAHADAITFAASSSVRAYAALKGPDGHPLPVPPLVICLGPTTAADARALGMTGVEEADGPSTEGVVAALARNLPTGS